VLNLSRATGTELPEASNIAANTLRSFAFRRLYSAVEGIAIAIGDALAKPLSDMAAWLGKAAGSITEWIKAWLNFRNFFIRIGYDAWHGLLAVVETVWHALEVGWIETTAFFSKAWSSFTGFFAKTWERIKSGAKKAWNWI